jgi:hypothetical protein
MLARELHRLLESGDDKQHSGLKPRMVQRDRRFDAGRRRVWQAAGHHDRARALECARDGGFLPTSDDKNSPPR